jgi:hypothetical protein
MLSSDIGPAHYVTAPIGKDCIPTENYRKDARHALRGRSGPETTTNEGRVAIFKPAGAKRMKELERAKGIEPSSRAWKVVGKLFQIVS